MPLLLMTDYFFTDILSVSQFLAQRCSDFDISSVGKVASSVKLIWHGYETVSFFHFHWKLFFRFVY